MRHLSCQWGFVRDSERLRSKTLLFAGVAILSNVLGNFALSQGMRQFGGVFSGSVASLLGTLCNAWIGTGVCLLGIWMVATLSLLSWADLSYVLPITASSYVFTAMLGAVALHETVSSVHWVGIVLIFLGVAVVGRTSPQTARVRARESS